MLRDLVQDLGVAARTFAARPLFAAVAVLTVALAIGANTVVFSLVHGILLRPPPYPEPDRLVSVWPDRFFSYRELVFLREHATTLRGVAGFVPGWNMTLTGSGDATKLQGGRVTANFFSVVGVPAARGRGFVADEESPGADGAVVLSGALWTSRFGSDPALVGSRVTLDGAPHTVVGVMPPAFEFYRPQTQVWRALAFNPEEWYYRGNALFVVARLAPGATVEQASAELVALTGRMREAFGYPDDFGAGASVASVHEWLAGSLRPTLLLALGAVGFVLLLAGANLANLLLARAAGRTREVAVRTALGASRGRLVRQLLAESVLLAGAGGAAGLTLAYATAGLATRLLPANTPLAAGAGLDGVVLVVSVALTLVVGVLFGLAPALTAVRANLHDALRAVRGGPGRAGRRTRSALVAAEVAVGMVLLVGAGLMLQTLWRLHRVDPGFRADGVLTLSVLPTGSRFGDGERRVEYYRELFARLSAVPGVDDVGAIMHLPLTGFGWGADVEVEGQPLAPGATPPRVAWRVIAGDYFASLRIPLVAGRAFEPTDRAGATPVAIVNREMAERLWPGESPLGRRLRAGIATLGEWATVIGVVGDVRHNGLGGEPVPELYQPFAQNPMGGLTVTLRTGGDPRGLARAATAVITEFDRDVPIANVQTFDEVARASLSQPRTLLALLGGFALVGLVLGAVGTYGVVALHVASRTREIGIRIALGAHPRAMVGTVLGQGVRLAALGVAVGSVVALLLGRVLSDFVYGVGTRDPVTLAAVGAGFLGIAALASYLPARRAAGVDPVTALRDE